MSSKLNAAAAAASVSNKRKSNHMPHNQKFRIVDYNAYIQDHCERSDDSDTEHLRHLLQQFNTRTALSNKTQMSTMRIPSDWDKGRICQELTRHTSLQSLGRGALPKHIEFESPALESQTHKYPIQPHGRKKTLQDNMEESEQAQAMCTRLAGYKKEELKALADTLRINVRSKHTKQDICEMIAKHRQWDPTTIRVDHDDEFRQHCADPHVDEDELYAYMQQAHQPVDAMFPDGRDALPTKQDMCDTFADATGMEHVAVQRYHEDHADDLERWQWKELQDAQCFHGPLQRQFPDVYRQIVTPRGVIDSNKVAATLRALHVEPTSHNKSGRLFKDCRLLIHALGGQWP
jgi:hypothetical protein